MEKIAVFVNDAAHAQRILQPMLEGAQPMHWVLVACPPTLTRHVGRWVTQSGREQWRERWSGALIAELEPALKATPGSVIDRVTAKRSLIEVSERLQGRFGPLRLLDARRPRIGKVDEPLTRSQPAEAPSHRWANAMAVTTGLSAVLALAD